MRRARELPPESGFCPLPRRVSVRTLRTVFVAAADRRDGRRRSRFYRSLISSAGHDVGSGARIGATYPHCVDVRSARLSIARPSPPAIDRSSSPRRFVGGLTVAQAALRRAKRTPAPHCGRAVAFCRPSALGYRSSRLPKLRLRRRLPSKRA